MMDDKQKRKLRREGLEAIVSGCEAAEPTASPGARIWLQKMAADARRLLGQTRPVTTNDRGSGRSPSTTKYQSPE